MSKRRQVDPVAAAGSALALVTAVVYIWLTSQVGGISVMLFRSISSRVAFYSSDQMNRPLVWVLAVLFGGTALAAYGAKITFSYRRTALLLAGAVLIVMGRLDIFSGVDVFLIGVPLFAAGLLCIVAAAWRRRPAMGA
jgi:hypothetical protein